MLRSRLQVQVGDDGVEADVGYPFDRLVVYGLGRTCLVDAGGLAKRPSDFARMEWRAANSKSCAEDIDGMKRQAN
jgi:hypothetical protein